VAPLNPEWLYVIEQSGLPVGSLPRWSLENYRTELESLESKVFTWGEGPQGFVLYRSLPDAEAWVMHLAVRDKGRGQGERMLEAWIEDLRSQEEPPKTVALEVSDLNLAALGLYRKLRFDEVGRRRGYYPDGSTALVMRREL